MNRCYWALVALSRDFVGKMGKGKLIPGRVNDTEKFTKVYTKKSLQKICLDRLLLIKQDL